MKEVLKTENLQQQLYNQLAGMILRRELLPDLLLRGNYPGLAVSDMTDVIRTLLEPDLPNWGNQ